MHDQGAIGRRTVQAEETLEAAARRMAYGNLTCLVALEEGTPRGVVTDRDLAIAVLCGGLDPSAPVSALAWRPLVSVVEGERADEAFRLMEVHGLRHLPVAGEAGRIVGMVAVEDALALLLHDLMKLASAAPAGAAMRLGGTLLRAEDTQVALPTIDGGASARALAELLRHTGAEALLIRKSEQPAGVVDERDLLPFVDGRRDADLVLARDLVHVPFASVDPGDPLEEVVQLMASHGVDHVAVVREERTLGMVSLKWLLARLAFELAKVLGKAVARSRETTARSPQAPRSGACGLQVPAPRSSASQRGRPRGSALASS